MPFQSEKQRKYLHANHPEIAKRWEKEYATGGISNLFKLKEGGRTGFRRGTSGAPGGGDPGMTSDSSGKGQTHSGGGGGYQNVHQTGAVTQTPGRTSTPKDDAPKDGPKPHEGDWDPGWLNKDLRTNLDKLNDKDSTRYEKEQALVWLDQHDKKIAASEKARSKSAKSSGLLGFLGKGILTLATAGAGAGLFGKDIMKAASLYNKYKKGKNIYNTLKKGEVELFGKKLNLNKVTNKLKSSDQKLMESLPKGHPERIALEAQMKVRTPPKQDGEGGATTSIKIEDIEAVNDANAEQVQLKKYREMELASYRAMIQQQEDRSKQMAYWKQMMAPYMAARGGRIPGYNTGGLSNLFRLKNR